MLSRNQRLTTRLFDEVMKSGASFHVPHFSLRIHRLNSQELSRFSFSVPKKVALRAVGRNRLKRHLSESVKAYIATIPLGLGIIVFAKKGAPALEFAEIKAEVHNLLSEAFSKFK